MIDFIGTILTSYEYRMIEFTKTITPPEIKENIEPLKGDDEKVRKYGIQFGI